MPGEKYHGDEIKKGKFRPSSETEPDPNKGDAKKDELPPLHGEFLHDIQQHGHTRVIPPSAEVPPALSVESKDGTFVEFFHDYPGHHAENGHADFLASRKTNQIDSYDSKGNLQEINVFKDGGHYSQYFDQQGKLIAALDIKYLPNNTLEEAVITKYDPATGKKHVSKTSDQKRLDEFLNKMQGLEKR